MRRFVVDNTYDYIIVGAGAAGSVLANRLSADPRNSVLLLEYGGSDINPMHHVPKGFFFTLRGNRYVYRYPTKPFSPHGAAEVWTRGKVSGGSSTVNGMMYVRGSERDYDGLVERGNPGWGWKDILPIFKQMERHVLGASSVRGGYGPYGVSFAETDEVSELILQAGEASGLKRVDDVNAEDVERIGMTPSSVWNGQRTSAATAFLRPALKRRNLTYLTRTRAGYLQFSGNRVTGVLAQRKGRNVTFRARKEVILSGGTIESTMLLERSGIGRPEVLQAAGIKPRVESPNVGERVLEQHGVAMQVKFKDPLLGLTSRVDSFPKQMWEGAKYLLNRKGPVADGGYNVFAAFKSSPELDRPDVQGLFTPIALDAESFDAVKVAKHAGAMFMGYQIRLPVIEPNYFGTAEDKDATASILNRGRRVFAQQPLSEFVAEEEFPGASVSSRNEVLNYAIETGSTIYHGVGANAMGPEDEDVVDPTLRVRGVEGLRVADVSVLPVQVSGNTAAPAMAIGWRAADFILSDN
jgi:choline dehydrogenase-like flavoprotein